MFASEMCLSFVFHTQIRVFYELLSHQKKMHIEVNGNLM